MYHVYSSGLRITDSPVSYNYILKNLFRDANLNWHELSALPITHGYKFNEFVIVRVN